ncbi:hypothetical protein AWW66_10805 [Micromonospora rosaria]|uniref:Secreted protein n=1 Tax=Micromonospora rosaria TaxID=47874 RepID=A0A136PUA8_9ACTN|nr:hypothetical protein [Micromonospora rosaria]KXK61924.1 hypothetical protein AWW66_10805 [Micromonospora rosaria]
MIRFRAFPVALACATLLTLTACGGEDTSDSAAPAATSSSAAPAAATPAAQTVSDKELCEAVQRTSAEMRDKLTAAVTKAATDESALTTATKEIMTELEQKLSALVPTGGADSEVAPALKVVAADLGKTAKAADPAAVADDPAAEKAGKDLDAACKKHGVTVSL